MRWFCCFPCLHITKRYKKVFAKSNNSSKFSAGDGSTSKMQVSASMDHYSYVEGVFILDKDKVTVISNPHKVGVSSEAPVRVHPTKVVEVRRRLASM